MLQDWKCLGFAAVFCQQSKQMDLSRTFFNGSGGGFRADVVFLPPVLVPKRHLRYGMILVKEIL